MHTMVNALVFSVVLATSGCQADRASVRATHDVVLTKSWQGYERVVVDTRNGRIDLSVGGGTELRVEAHLHAAGETLEQARANVEHLSIIAQADSAAPGTFLLKLEVPESLNDFSPGANFVVRLPQACAAEASTSNGGIRAEGLKGRLELASSNGNVTVAQIDGDVKAATSNGSITARSIRGHLGAKTSNGAIVVEDAQGQCELETSNGKIRTAGVRGDVSAVTSNSAIEVDATPADMGQVILTTCNGPITVTVPRTLRASVALTTSNANIHAAFGDIPVKIQTQTPYSVQAVLNGGGGKIVGTTANAPITLKFREDTPKP